jgi:hypothetical protein
VHEYAGCEIEVSHLCVTDNGYYNLGKGQTMSVALDKVKRLAAELGVTDQLPSLAWTTADLEREAHQDSADERRGGTATPYISSKEPPTFGRWARRKHTPS